VHAANLTMYIINILVACQYCKGLEYTCARIWHLISSFFLAAKV